MWTSHEYLPYIKQGELPAPLGRLFYRKSVIHFDSRGEKDHDEESLEVHLTSPLTSLEKENPNGHNRGCLPVFIRDFEMLLARSKMTCFVISLLVLRGPTTNLTADPLFERLGDTHVTSVILSQYPLL